MINDKSKFNIQNVSHSISSGRRFAQTLPKKTNEKDIGFHDQIVSILLSPMPYQLIVLVMLNCLVMRRKMTSEATDFRQCRMNDLI